MNRGKREKVTCPLDGWPPPMRGKDGKIRFPGVSGKCHKHHSWCVRQFKAEQAGWRNELTPNDRRASYRDAQAKRRKRPKAEPEVPVITCPWPWKDAHPDKAAARRKLAWLKARDDKDFRTAEAYKCPGPDDHWHLGNPAVPAERSRKERYQRDEEAA